MSVSRGRHLFLHLDTTSLGLNSPRLGLLSGSCHGPNLQATAEVWQGYAP